MTVTARLHASLKRFSAPGEGGVRTVELAHEAVVGDLIAALGVPEGFAGAFFVNGERAEADTPLTEGAHVDVFPPIGGGRGETGRSP